MKSTFSTLPMVECPHCNKEFQFDDYYDIEEGTECECPRCEKTMYFANVDTQITASVRTEKK